MNSFLKKNTRLRRIAYFFPFQLLLVVLKKNQFLMFFWLILFGLVTKNIGMKYGVPFLFLNPEYLGVTDFWSYMINGFATGGFIMAFNISTYIVNGFRFPFLATLSRPFFKFCLNNCIVPVLFILVYSKAIYDFQMEQFVSPSKAFIDIAGFLSGIFCFVTFTLTYFGTLNKDIFKLFGVEINQDADPVKFELKKDRDWHVETYLSNFHKINLARGFHHYDKEMLINVFKQHHFNAAFFEIMGILSLIVLGIFQDTPAFEIPAGASIILLFTMMIMLPSAIHTWLRGWSTTVSIILIVMVNYMNHLPFIYNYNKAYGLNYEGAPAHYSYDVLKNLNQDGSIRKQDTDHMIEILNNWRLKNVNTSIKKKQKPKMVFINTSGGGIRSSLWAFLALQHADSLLDGELLNHTCLITGSSGGMVGAAYLRELYLREQLGEMEDVHDSKFVLNMSKDLLNPIAFTLTTNDLFFKFSHFNDGKYRYAKDRAYAFERQLHENTDFIIDKRLGDYTIPEAKAQIPMVMMSPTTLNDGRRLMIAAQPVSFLTQNEDFANLGKTEHVNSIEYSRFFQEQDAMNLHFSSALRMNATFPYIMPVVSLPSEPRLEVMDAGMRDNYGLETTLKFIYSMRNWISSNTSGVVIIQTRDRHKEFPIEENPPSTISKTLSKPLGSFYNNLFRVQDYNHDQLLEFSASWFDGNIEVIDLELENRLEDNISLSWHLTEKEKEKVLKSIDLPRNQEAIQRIKLLLE